MCKHRKLKVSSEVGGDIDQGSKKLLLERSQRLFKEVAKASSLTPILKVPIQLTLILSMYHDILIHNTLNKSLSVISCNEPLYTTQNRSM